VLDAYPPLAPLQQKRLAARRHKTTYCYDFPSVFGNALREAWAARAAAGEPNAVPPPGAGNWLTFDMGCQVLSKILDGPAWLQWAGMITADLGLFSVHHSHCLLYSQESTVCIPDLSLAPSETTRAGGNRPPNMQTHLRRAAGGGPGARGSRASKQPPLARGMADATGVAGHRRK